MSPSIVMISNYLMALLFQRVFAVQDGRHKWPGSADWTVEKVRSHQRKRRQDPLRQSKGDSGYGWNRKLKNWISQIILDFPNLLETFSRGEQCSESGLSSDGVRRYPRTVLRSQRGRNGSEWMRKRAADQLFDSFTAPWPFSTARNFLTTWPLSDGTKRKCVSNNKVRT